MARNTPQSVSEEASSSDLSDWNTVPSGRTSSSGKGSVAYRNAKNPKTAYLSLSKALVGDASHASFMINGAKTKFGLKLGMTGQYTITARGDNMRYINLPAMIIEHLAVGATPLEAIDENGLLTFTFPPLPAPAAEPAPEAPTENAPAE